MKSKPVEFQAPKDASLPEGLEPNEDFDVTCTFRMKDTGTICMVKFGDAEMPYPENGNQRHYEKQDKPGYGEMAKGMMSMGENE